MRQIILLPLFVSLVLLFGFSHETVASQASHTVGYGDTLSGIAQAYGLDTQALAEANNIVNPNYIFIGQNLVIPNGGTAGASAVGSASSGVNRVHYVQWGETMQGIAVAYGSTIGAIQSANGLVTPHYIYAGQQLVIPASGAGYTPPAPDSVWGKSIVVDLSDQRTYVYQNGQLIYNFLSSTGQPGNETWAGRWAVRTMLPEAYAATWSLRMPHWIGFYTTGALENGFHALPIMANGQVLWAGYLGTPVSYGCVILSHADAATLYNWTTVGTEVIVQP